MKIPREKHSDFEARRAARDTQLLRWRTHARPEVLALCDQKEEVGLHDIPGELNLFERALLIRNLAAVAVMLVTRKCLMEIGRPFSADDDPPANREDELRLCLVPRLLQVVDKLVSRVRNLERETKHWKSNHDSVLSKKKNLEVKYRAAILDWHNVQDIPEDDPEYPFRLGPVELYSPLWEDEDFNPSGIILGFWCDHASFYVHSNEASEPQPGWVGTVWDAENDVWDTSWVQPTHYRELKRPTLSNAERRRLENPETQPAEYVCPENSTQTLVETAPGDETPPQAG